MTESKSVRYNNRMWLQRKPKENLYHEPDVHTAIYLKIFYASQNDGYVYKLIKHIEWTEFSYLQRGQLEKGMNLTVEQHKTIVNQYHLKIRNFK